MAAQSGAIMADNGREQTVSKGNHGQFRQSIDCLRAVKTDRDAR